MKDLALDLSTGLLARDGFGLRLTSSIDEYVAQKIDVKLRLFKGEWYLNTNLGIPYLPGEDELQPDQATLSTAIRAALLTTAEVDSIVSFNTAFNGRTRQFNCNWVVKLKTGEALSGSI